MPVSIFDCSSIHYFFQHVEQYVILSIVTDGELAVVSKSLHDSDVNGLVLELDLQGRTTVGSPSDMASNRYRKILFFTQFLSLIQTDNVPIRI